MTDTPNTFAAGFVADEATVERAAKAQHDFRRRHYNSGPAWEDIDWVTQERWRKSISAAISALTPPAEPNEADRSLNGLIESICRDVAELPDRTSPDDWPEAMLVTADELTTILSNWLATEAQPGTASAPEVAGLIERLHGNARQLRNFYAGESGTGLHVLAADTADEAAAVLSALLAREERLREALEALCVDVENGWGDPHTLADARTALEANDAGIGEGVGK